MVLSAIQVWRKLKVLHGEYKEHFRKVVGQSCKHIKKRKRNKRKNIFLFVKIKKCGGKR